MNKILPVQNSIGYSKLNEPKPNLEKEIFQTNDGKNSVIELLTEEGLLSNGAEVVLLKSLLGDGGGIIEGDAPTDACCCGTGVDAGAGANFAMNTSNLVFI